ncbi:MAG: DUF3501 family protein, partial [Pseudomonadota bacterium]
MKHQLTRDDLLPVAVYIKVRGERRRSIIAQKERRRLDVGPVATIYFESFDSMW